MSEIPTVKDYDHWGEEAAAVWYAENRYDMENEIDDFDRYDRVPDDWEEEDE